MIVVNSSAHQQLEKNKTPDSIPLNILIVGESQSGKTVLRHLLSTTNQPLNTQKHFTQTIGVEFSAVEEAIVSDCFSEKEKKNSASCLPKVRLFEIVGGSRFRTLLVNPTSQLYDGCIFVLSRKEKENCGESIHRMSYLLSEIEECFRIKKDDDNDDENENCDGKDIKNHFLKPVYVCFIGKTKNDDDDFLNVAKEMIRNRIEEGEVRMFSLFDEDNDETPALRQMLKEIVLKSLLAKTGSTELPRSEKNDEKKTTQEEAVGFMSKVAKFFFGSS